VLSSSLPYFTSCCITHRLPSLAPNQLRSSSPSLAAMAQVRLGHDQGGIRKWLRQKSNTARLQGVKIKYISFAGALKGTKSWL